MWNLHGEPPTVVVMTEAEEGLLPLERELRELGAVDVELEPKHLNALAQRRRRALQAGLGGNLYKVAADMQGRIIGAAPDEDGGVMPRRATGQVVVDSRRTSPVYALRFTANGRRQYVTLGSARDGWTQAKAQDQLERELAAVRLGTWKAPEPEPAPTVEQDPTFHVFASDWFAAHEREWRPKTQKDYEWKLSDHLLPFFQHHRLSQITIAEVDRYRTAKLKQGTLSPTSINKTIALLAQVLEDAVEFGQMDRNPARGRGRRLKADKPVPVWLDSAEQIAALLDAAGELDREARADRQVPRRAILATLTFAGLRIGELVELRWRDVDLVGRP